MRARNKPAAPTKLTTTSAPSPSALPPRLDPLLYEVLSAYVDKNRINRAEMDLTSREVSEAMV